MSVISHCSLRHQAEFDKQQKCKNKAKMQHIFTSLRCNSKTKMTNTRLKKALQQLLPSERSFKLSKIYLPKSDGLDRSISGQVRPGMDKQDGLEDGRRSSEEEDELPAEEFRSDNKQCYTNESTQFTTMCSSLVALNKRKLLLKINKHYVYLVNCSSLLYAFFDYL